MCIGIAVYILKRVSSTLYLCSSNVFGPSPPQVSHMRAARAASKRKLYDSSEEDTSEERRYMGRI